MEGVGSRGAESREQKKELDAFKRELTPAFEGPFAVLGHGTNVTNAPAILVEGLKVRTPLLQTTAIPLEHSRTGMQTILHWPHHDHKAVIVIAIPLETPSNAELFDEIKTEYGEELPYLLPSRFIRGYIDVENRKFIPNPHFEEHPAYRLKELPKSPLEGLSSSNAEVEIPSPTGSADEADIF